MERAGKVIARWKASAAGVSNEDLARAAWRAAVGRKIAAHTTGIDLVRQHLIIRVDDDIWRRQLWTLRGQILGNLTSLLGEAVVEDLEIRLAPRRMPPGRAATPQPSADEADHITDPHLRRAFKTSRKRAHA